MQSKWVAQPPPPPPPLFATLNLQFLIVVPPTSTSQLFRRCRRCRRRRWRCRRCLLLLLALGGPGWHWGIASPLGRRLPFAQVACWVARSLLPLLPLMPLPPFALVSIFASVAAAIAVIAAVAVVVVVVAAVLFYFILFSARVRCAYFKVQFLQVSCFALNHFFFSILFSVFLCSVNSR